MRAVFMSTLNRTLGGFGDALRAPSAAFGAFKRSLFLLDLGLSLRTFA
jgi:hypothetical protein